MKKILSVFLSVIMLLSITAGLDLTAFADDSYSVGDIIEFGSYPQSKVTDEDTLSALNSLSLDWVSYGYYSGTGGGSSMTQSDYMQYADVTFNGEKYRAVTFSQYRPLATYYTSSATYQDDNGYSTDTVYWFKYEPIKWRILDPSTGLVISETSIDSQAYSNTEYTRISGGMQTFYNDTSYTYDANDYYTSSIRAWLNDDFYNTAFTSTEKNYINTTELDNSAYSTDYSRFDSQTSYDKVFLLSYSDALNTDYGFSSNPNDCDTVRWAQGSDYAESQGLSVFGYDVEYESYEVNCCWLLRSAGYMSGVCTIVNYDGTVDPCENTTSNTEYGIRPALCFDFSFTSHTVSDAVTENEVAATCTQDGSYDSVVYCSDCGEELSRETITVPATGHNYTSTVIAPTCTAEGSQTYTCSVCGYSYTEELSATGHTAGEAVIENEVTATCTQDGSYDSVVYCTVCNEEISRTAQIISATGHNYDSIVVTDPTCTADGYTTYTCTTCGDSYTADIVPATGHAYTSVVTAPTCTTQGYTTYTCTACGDSYTADTVPATGHNYTSAVTALTCTTQGYTTYTCTVCGNSYTDNYIPAAGHSYSSVVTAPTSTTQGYTTYTCVNCGDTYISDIVPATGTTSSTKPQKPKIKKFKKAKKGFKLTWKEVSSATGYEIQYATNKKFTKSKKTVTIKKSSATSKTIKGLKSKKTYYVRIRTYKTVNGKKVYSDWSAVEKVKTK